MSSLRAAALTEADRDLVARSLRAAINGPYFPDWEIGILTAFSRDELVKVLDAWPEAVAVAEWSDDPEQTQFVAVNNVLNNLIGYPHGHWECCLRQDLGGADPDRLVRLLAAWRGETVDGYADAIE